MVFVQVLWMMHENRVRTGLDNRRLDELHLFEMRHRVEFNVPVVRGVSVVAKIECENAVARKVRRPESRLGGGGGTIYARGALAAGRAQVKTVRSNTPVSVSLFARAA